MLFRSFACLFMKATGRLASYRLHEETGELSPLETYSVGQRPMWVLTTRLGDA